jgi:hypothetical protein
MSEHNEPAGHPANEIRRQIKTSSIPSPVRQDSRADSHAGRSEFVDTARPGIESVQSAEEVFSLLSISAKQIAAPAFFVDKKLSLRWITPNGSDAFSRSLALEMASASTRNIFDLLLRPAIKGSLSDWQALFTFVYTLLRRSTSRDTFDTGTVFISKAYIFAPPYESIRHPDIHDFQVDSCMIASTADANQAPQRIFGLEFKTGTLFLIRQDHWAPAVNAGRENESSIANIDPVDKKKAICILSARLNNSRRIADSMLPGFYFNAIHRICEETDDVVRSFGGIRAGSNGAEIRYMFTESAGRNPIFSALCSATRMNGRMSALEEKLKTQQEWADEIHLNMGISHGKDDRTTPEPSVCMEFMMPGGAFDQSSHLSAIAEKGEIWVTKNAVTQLPQKLLNRVVLGVDRQGQFLRNFFTRISELPPVAGPSQSNLDLGALSIARVLKIRK